MPPIVFYLTENRTLSGRSLGVGPAFTGRLPLPAVRLRIVGITKDAVGTVIGSATVKLYRTVDDALMDTCVSDAVTGSYSFSAIGLCESYYAVAYKAGAPDLSGTTVNTLVGV